jgi:PII-like signaling protein
VRNPTVPENPKAETEQPALRLHVHIGESDHHGGQPLYTAIVEAARRAGLAGATVFKGIEGYGAHSVVHAARIVDLSADLPIVIELIDSAAAIHGFLPALTAMVADGLITLEDVRIVYRGEGKAKR